VPLRPAGFFNCWTRKEAYIKAVGLGLSYPLERFTVSLAPGVPARLEAVEIDSAHVEAWTMASLAPRSGFVGAVVVGARPVEVVCERLGEDRR
jgi:4'-phosphopantetheinyl transferase